MYRSHGVKSRRKGPADRGFWRFCRPTAAPLSRPHCPRASVAGENARDRLDLIAGVDRQSGADRLAAVERTLAGQDLDWHQVPQHRNLCEFLPLAKDIRLD